MTASEDRARQTHHEHHGTLQKQLHLRSLVLFGLAYMTPIIVLGIFGVIAQLSDGGSAGSYLLATVAMLFTALSYGLMAKHFPVAGSAYTYVRKALDSRLGFVVGWAILLDYLFLPLVIWLIGGSYLQGQFPNVPFFVWIVAYIVLTSALNVIGLKVADHNSSNSGEPMKTLRVGAAFPDPPFNGMKGRNGGLDIDLMTAIAESLGATVEFVPYDGTDFNGIFDALGYAYDCVAAGTTVTPDRETKAQFVPPYLTSGQSLAVDTTRLPDVKSIDDLASLTIGVQQGNTSQPIADELVVQGKAANVRVYDYDNIRTALTDLTTGGCDAFMKLAPVLTELVKPIPGVEVVQRGISVEKIAIAVPLNDQALLGRITVAQAELEDNGTLQRIRRKWLGNPFADQNLKVL